MKTDDFYYDSADTRHLVYAKIWMPEREPVGVVQFVHGMYEHSGRYAETAQALCAQGFVCCINDLLGHGRTAAGDGGFFGYNNGLVNLLADVRTLTARVSKRYPDLPYFLCGFSMGSYLTRLLIAEPDYARPLAGAVLAGTSGPNPSVSKLRARADDAVRSQGPKQTDAALNALTLSSFEKYFEPRPFSWMTAIEGRRLSYEQDPMSQFQFANTAIRDVYKMMALSALEHSYERVPPELPLLILSGKDDPNGAFGAGVRAVAAAYIQSGLDDVSMRLFAGVRHDVLRDYPATQNRTLPYLSAWLRSRT